MSDHSTTLNKLRTLLWIASLLAACSRPDKTRDSASSGSNSTSPALQGNPSIPRGETPAEARQRGLKLEAANLTPLGTRDDSLEFIAGEFFGYYFKFGRALSTYCTQRNAEIPRYLAVFDEINARERSAAIRTLARRGQTPEALFDQVHEQISRELDMAIESSIARRAITEAEYCIYLEQHLDYVRVQFPFSRMNARSDSILLAASSR